MNDYYQLSWFILGAFCEVIFILTGFPNHIGGGLIWGYKNAILLVSVLGSLGMTPERKAASHSSRVWKTSNFCTRAVSGDYWRPWMCHSAGDLPLTQWTLSRGHTTHWLVYRCPHSSRGELVKRTSISHPCELCTQAKCVLNPHKPKCCCVKLRSTAKWAWGSPFIKQRDLH